MRRLSLVLLPAATSLSLLVANPVSAACDPNNLTVDTGIACATPPGASPRSLVGGGSIFTVVTNTLIFLVGAISILMIIIGGLRYVLSSGNEKAVTDAKNTILYAVIGVVVALAAYAIVNFVTTKAGF